MPGFVTAHNGLRTSGGLVHASPVPPVPEGPRAGRYRAACGTLVRNVTTFGWTPTGVIRRCPDCVKATAP